MTATRHLHPAELLPEYAAGVLPEALEPEVQEHLSRCGECVAELRALEEIFAQLALALPAPPPPPSLRERVLRSLGVDGRFESFLARIAAMLDVAVERARELVALIDDGAAWVQGPAVARLIHLPGGPRVAHANCGFIRVRSGEHFPEHRHLGTEHALILQGALVDSNGQTYRPGDECVLPTGSQHAFTAVGDVDLIFLVVLENGIEMAGGPVDV